MGKVGGCMTVVVGGNVLHHEERGNCPGGGNVRGNMSEGNVQENVLHSCIRTVRQWVQWSCGVQIKLLPRNYHYFDVPPRVLLTNLTCSHRLRERWQHVLFTRHMLPKQQLSYSATGCACAVCVGQKESLEVHPSIHTCIFISKISNINVQTTKMLSSGAPNINK